MTPAARAHPRFDGCTVALLEARLADETANMVRRLGGVPVAAPAVHEQSLDADSEVSAAIDRLATTSNAVVILLTGAAVTHWFATAERLGREAELVAALRRSLTIARGPKPAGALSRRGIVASIAVAEPFTTNDVIDALDQVPLAGRPAMLVHYGERNVALVSALAARGAVVAELFLYEWRLPADTAPLVRLIDALIAGTVPIVVFTSQVQVRHLLEVAGTGRRDALIAALNNRVVVGAVGPTCAAACVAAGMDQPVVPDRPKLGSLLQAVAAAFHRIPDDVSGTTTRPNEE